MILASGLYSAYKIKTQLPYVRFLAKHGIMGDSPGAKWVGINEYFREHTPADATVLALVMRDYLWRAEGLRVDGSLKIRTGRSMPICHPIMAYFNYQKQLWMLDQERHLTGLIAGWGQHDWTAVATHLDALGAPDYLVVPIEQGQWLPQASDCPYRLETTINGFQILRRGHDA